MLTSGFTDNTGRVDAPHLVLDDLLREEADHRLSNLLQMLSSSLVQSSRHTGEADARAVISAAAGQVVRLGRLQHLLAIKRNPARGDLRADVGLLCEILDLLVLAPWGHRLVLAAITTPATPVLPANQNRVLLLCLTEFILNSAKHAFPAEGVGRIDVTLSYASDRIACVVSDNGVGTAFLDTSRDCGGMVLVQRIAEMAGGRCCWVFSLTGSTAEVSLPIVERPTLGRARMGNEQMAEARN